MSALLSGMLTDLGLAPGTVVVCPSLSFPVSELRKIIGIGHYEERLLYLLLALGEPGVRIVYLSSIPIDPAVVDYYLSFLKEGAGEARRRVHFLSVDDPSVRPLCAKLLDKPALVEELRSLTAGHRGHTLPFNVTECEALLASEIGQPLVGPGPELTYLGSKSGARRVAKAAGVNVADGAEDLRSVEAIERAVASLLERRPGMERVVLKLNNGFSGQGNAILSPATGRLATGHVTFCAAEETWSSFASKAEAEGCVVEELVSASDLVSPSVQVWLHRDGRVEVLSTHDQILGGPDDQVYLGCRFPAQIAYRSRIVEDAKRIGAVLASNGVIGPFGVDFLVWGERFEHVVLSEINLRMGGTTHPFGMARLVTGAYYDEGRGELTVGGTAKCYVATDNLKSDAYKGLHPQQVIDAVHDSGIAFDPQRATGVTVHLIGALPRFGKLGATCIGNSPEECDDLLGRFVAEVDALAQRASERARGGRV